MKKGFAIAAGFLMLALLDSLLAYSFPIDFTYQRVSVVWHFYFIGMLVFVHDKPWLTRWLAASLAGICADFFFEGSFPFCFLVYPLFALGCGFFAGIMDNNRYAFVIYLLCCFILDFGPYVFLFLNGTTNIPLHRWLYCIELVTVFTNAGAVLLIMYLDIVMVRFFLIQSHLNKKAERRRRAALNANSRTT